MWLGSKWIVCDPLDQEKPHFVFTFNTQLKFNANEVFTTKMMFSNSFLAWINKISQRIIWVRKVKQADTHQNRFSFSQTVVCNEWVDFTLQQTWYMHKWYFTWILLTSVLCTKWTALNIGQKNLLGGKGSSPQSANWHTMTSLCEIILILVNLYEFLPMRLSCKCQLVMCCYRTQKKITRDTKSKHTATISSSTSTLFYITNHALLMT